MRTLQASRSLLKIRVGEMAHLLKYLQSSENSRMSGIVSHEILPNTEVSAIMKAAVLMMNYSMAEALIVEVLNELFTDIKLSKLQLSDLSKCVRRHLLNYKIRATRKAADPKIGDLLEEVIDNALGKIPMQFPEKTHIRDSFLGNLDARKIRELASELGIKLNSSRRTLGGSDLKEMKESRNSLAHGHRSFVDLGQLKSHGDVQIQTRRVVEYLLAVVRSFEQAISEGALREAL